MELALTTGLVSVIMGTASGTQNVGIIAAFGIGAYIALAGLWAPRFPALDEPGPHLRSRPGRHQLHRILGRCRRADRQRRVDRRNRP